jgi:hypothetical protein
MVFPSTEYPYLCALENAMPYPASLRSAIMWAQTSNLAWSGLVLRCVGRSMRPYWVPNVALGAWMSTGSATVPVSSTSSTMI